MVMKIKMISWNVRGLNDPQKCLVVKAYPQTFRGMYSTSYIYNIYNKSPQL